VSIPRKIHHPPRSLSLICSRSLALPPTIPAPPIVPAVDPHVTPLWIQLFRRGMPSPFPPLLHSPRAPRRLCFRGWLLYFSAFPLHRPLPPPAPSALTSGDASRANGPEWMAHWAFRSLPILWGAAWSEGLVGPKHRHGRCPLLILAIRRDLPTVSKNEQNHDQDAFTLSSDSAKRISNHECWNRFEK